MSAAWAVAVAAIFVWLGMVLAISFLEAPLKFRAPGVTLPLGLGIGRLVFRALNTCEAMLAAVVLVALFFDMPPARIGVPILVAVAALVAQLVFVRPALTKRSDVVLAGAARPALPDAAEPAPARSNAHYGYVVLEVVKVVALIVGGVLLLAA